MEENKELETGLNNDNGGQEQEERQEPTVEELMAELAKERAEKIGRKKFII